MAVVEAAAVLSTRMAEGGDNGEVERRRMWRRSAVSLAVVGIGGQ
jgi:hypothetical protein